MRNTENLNWKKINGNKKAGKTNLYSHQSVGSYIKGYLPPLLWHQGTEVYKEFILSLLPAITITFIPKSDG